MTAIKKIAFMGLPIIVLVTFKEEKIVDGLVLLFLSSITFFTVAMIFSLSKRNFKEGLFDGLLAAIQFLILSAYCLTYLS